MNYPSRPVTRYWRMNQFDTSSAGGKAVETGSRSSKGGCAIVKVVVVAVAWGGNARVLLVGLTWGDDLK